jgi:prepilin-type N-terminal cleavage/methylation domain-containing protein
MNRPTGSSLPAFTLIELLVVIAIIAILAAILFPVVRAGATVSARRVVYQQYPPDIARNADVRTRL